jgi:hypothetical protein
VLRHKEAQHYSKEIGYALTVKNITLPVGRPVLVVELQDFLILLLNFRKGIGFAKDAMNIIIHGGLIALFVGVRKKVIRRTGGVQRVGRITLRVGFIVFTVKRQNLNKQIIMRKRRYLRLCGLHRS